MISPNDKTPTFSPTKRLDYELEVGVFLGGQLNDYGESLNIKDVEPFIFGFVLLNDWSGNFNYVLHVHHICNFIME